MKLILASTSPRRRDLLTGAGYELEIVTPDGHEIEQGDPIEVVLSNARSKARSIEAGGIVVGADTIVVCDGEILGKPRDARDARRMITLQMQHLQEVITGICVVRGDRELCGFESSAVVMDPCDDIDEYLDSGLWEGKAGGYGLVSRYSPSTLTVNSAGCPGSSAESPGVPAATSASR